MNEVARAQKKLYDKNKNKLYGKQKKSTIFTKEVNELKKKYGEISSGEVKKFTDFPLSGNTLQGLEIGRYEEPTDIQKESIGLALQEQDVLGAAKTGSGKTLAFLIPVLECLYRNKWGPQDGMGALIISPTRELAYQTFGVLRKIGKMHDFSAGLVIGGKFVREEAERIARTNIVICTPGRLLQHMDQTPLFNADQLQILVLDEADRILDLGFRDTLNAIIENLPSHRQTLLFSATQTKSVKDLARLSLKNPMYVSVHENAKHSTPAHLEQNYIVAELDNKINIIWSFIKSHLRKKLIIFLQSCKQVRFLYECVRTLRPGMTVLALHGIMNQMKRMDVYQQFCRKNSVCLFATDIAARGLDFPTVDWVIQYDCPEDATTYIHRVGRTARYNQNGQALLILLPSEEAGMVEQLEAKKIPINKIKVNPKQTWDIQPRIESFCASDVNIKDYAKRAFMSYIRSVYLMKNKAVFDVAKLDFEKFSRSLGLAITPRVRFLQRASAKKEKHKKSLKNVSEETKNDTKNEIETKEQTDTDVTERGEFSALGGDEDESDDDILTVKSKSSGGQRLSNDTSSEDESESEIESKKLTKTQKLKKKALTKAAMAKRLLRKKYKTNTKIEFDDEGEEIPSSNQSRTVIPDIETSGGLDISKAKEYLEKEDKYDKELFRQKIKQRHKDEKKKIKKRIKEIKEEEAIEEEAILSGDEETNLDLLPDPDRVYGAAGSHKEDSWQSGSESDQEGRFKRSDDSSSQEDEDRVPRKKQKMLVRSETLEDDEALALSLLRS